MVDNQVDQTTGTVRMKAEFPNANLQLWPGQFVNVRVLVDTLKQVVVIPTPAVQRGPNGAFAYVVRPDQSVVACARSRSACKPRACRHRQGHRAVRARRHHRLRAAEGRRARDRCRAEGQPAGGADGHPPRRPRNRAAATRAACAGDVQKLCANVERGREAIRACLQANAAQLSEACKAAVAAPARR